tara:strand:+ start:14821 stop:15501 length:681 start_codon:yes stop_codon:yes gene_type:complete
VNVDKQVIWKDGVMALMKKLKVLLQKLKKQSVKESVKLQEIKSNSDGVELNAAKMTKISDHVSYKEGIYSRTALRRGIDNTPGPDQLKCMMEIAENVFEPLREWVGGPIKINSFFRGKKLNTAIGGSKTSQHMKGQAMDIDDTFGHKTNAEMYHYIKNNLLFDQMIWEFGDDNNPNWIHVSFVTHRKNRRKLTVAYKDEFGKTKYMHTEKHETRTGGLSPDCGPRL